MVRVQGRLQGKKMYGYLNLLSEKQLACMYCSDQQIRLIRFLVFLMRKPDTVI